MLPAAQRGSGEGDHMHYLDYAATAPVLPAAAEAMLRELTEDFGNPSAQYALGRAARDRMEERRAVIAAALGGEACRLRFTSCGTEGDNWAIRAALWQNRRLGKHIITTAVEHSAVLACLKALESEGYEVTYLKPDSRGNITAAQVAEALRADTALVSVMLVNNEIGNRYPIEDIAALLQNRDTLLHTDAVQAFLKIPFTARTLGADLITLSAHKLGGPKGIGALYIGPRLPHPRPLLYGGGQEDGLLPGTEPTAQIAGFAAAVAHWQANLNRFRAHMSALRAEALTRLKTIPGLVEVGAGAAPHILSVSLTGYPSQNIVTDLSDRGICISAGSACHRGRASHVLTAMSIDKRTAAGTLRVSLGPETTMADIEALAEALADHQSRRFPML